MHQPTDPKTNAEERNLDDELSGNLLDTVDMPDLTVDQTNQDDAEQQELPPTTSPD